MYRNAKRMVPQVPEVATKKPKLEFNRERHTELVRRRQAAELAQLTDARRRLREEKQNPVYTMAEIIWAVSQATGIGAIDIRGKTRARSVVAARHIACYMGRKYTGMSYPQIGQLLGGRDHSTVLHGKRKVENNMDEYRWEVNKAIRMLEVGQ